jgi:hypothetical protein
VRACDLACQRPHSAPDIDDAFERLEIYSCNDRAVEDRKTLLDALEHGRHHGVVGKIPEESLPMCGIEGGVASANAMKQLAPRLPVQGVTAEARHGSEGVATIRPQCLRERRQRESAWLNFT